MLVFVDHMTVSLPLSGECRSVAEEEERRLVMTGSACLDRFIVDTERLSPSNRGAAE